MDIGESPINRSIFDVPRRPTRGSGRQTLIGGLSPKNCWRIAKILGSNVTEYYGIEHPTWQWVGIILLGPIWFTALVYIHFNEGTELVKKMTKIDYVFRWIMVFTIIASVAYGFLSDRLDAEPWVGAKLIIFAALIFCGIMIRKNIGGFIKGIHNIVNDNINDADDEAMVQSLSKARVFVITIWILLLVEAGIGVVKPGSMSLNSPSIVQIEELQ